MSSSAYAHAQAARSRAQERDAARGYSINYKRLTLAFLAEIVVVATSLAGAWLFAQQYGMGDLNTMAMMMLAPVGYAVVELARVPLALSVRTQRSFIMKLMAVIGVICAAGVTIKSVAQLGEIMFRPRLVDVVRKHEALIAAENDHASFTQRIRDADAVVAQRSRELQAAETHLSGSSTQLGGLPPEKCQRVSGTNRNGRRYTALRCKTDPRVAVMAQNLKDAQVARDEAARKLDEARSERAKLDRTETDRRFSDAQVAHKDAVLHSQLHSFTGMAFGKDPTQVTDGEIHQFLRIFVFFPAIFVSLASTLLALTSVEKIKPTQSTEVDDGAGVYILEPFAEHIVKEATAAAEQVAAAALERARPPALKVVKE